ncbi:unnamed protein product [Brassica oleracea var. botrytis]
MNHAVSASIGLAPSRNEKQDLKKQWCGVEMSKEGSGGGGSGAEQEEEEEEEEKGREDRDARRMESEDHDGGIQLLALVNEILATGDDASKPSKIPQACADVGLKRMGDGIENGNYKRSKDGN